MAKADLPPSPANDAVAYRNVARVGLVVVFGILVSCFGLLIAASSAAI